MIFDVSKKHIILSLLLIMSFATSCERDSKTAERKNVPMIDAISTAAWASLSSKRIFFGHQSVGDNILDGIRDIANKNSQIKLYVTETNDPQQFNHPLLAH